MKELAFIKANPVAGLAEVELVEACIGLRLPDGFRTYLLSKPTGTLATKNNMLALAAKPLAAAWVETFGSNSFINQLLGASDGREGIVGYCQHLRREDSLPPLLVPIATDWVGNIIVIACANSSEGLVSYYDRESATFYPLFASYAEFVDALEMDVTLLDP